MRGLTGLSAIAGYQTRIDADAQATPEERSGGTADPRHGTIVREGKPYAWETPGPVGQQGPDGPENQMLGDESWFWFPGGDYADDPAMDLTPSHRAGPWPKGVASGAVPGEGPDDISEQLRQSAIIHGIDTNAGARTLRTLPPLNDTWEGFDQTNPGHSDLMPLPKQAMSSGFMWGTTDRTQSMARQNGHGFDSAHQDRRWATGAIPGNTMWMRPGGRPLAKTLAGPARPAIGPGSPFAGQNLGAAFSIDGAVLQNMPTEYAPPPQPTLANAMPASEDYSPVEWY